MQSVLTWVFNTLHEVFIGWLESLCRVLQEAERADAERRRRREQGERRYVPCQTIPSDVYKRPDPLIYCQTDLMARGLAVTWDNPDIQLFEPGPPRKPIPSNDLKPATFYEVEATIYNGSAVAPAMGLPVEFSYLSFGIGTQSHPIGTVPVDLHVKGSPLHPAKARIRWRTPPEPGHYCLQVKLIWADDANPNNNLGQENTNVGVAHSPAVFDFATHNGTRRRREVTLVADMYQIPPPADCEELARRQQPQTPEEQEAARQNWCIEAARAHDPEKFPVTPPWKVEIAPAQFGQDPGETTTVKVTVTPPDGWTGLQAVNISGHDDIKTPLGGVTLYVKRD